MSPIAPSNSDQRQMPIGKLNSGIKRLLAAAFAVLLSSVSVIAVLGPLLPAHAAGISDAALKAPKMTKVIGNAAPTWVELTALQQHILTPLAPDWDKLKPTTRRKWLEISGSYVKMTPAEQERLQARMGGWITLTPEQRRIARENYAHANNLDIEQRALRWQQYQQLSEEQKKELAEQAAPRHKRLTTMPPAILNQSKPTAPVNLAPKSNAEQTAVMAPTTATASPASMLTPTAK